VKLKSTQLYRCPCDGEGPQSFSPLAERLPERTSPELAYLESKFAALVFYGLTVELLREALLIHQEFTGGVAEALLLAKQQGKVRFIGFTGHNRMSEPGDCPQVQTVGMQLA
jgi:hypothetical protein